ncbi:Bro-N domain-containing protein [Vibrio chagasii]|uniref:BRO-N domain-containing protein n=1 Tax=Vibrio chagasii TaxID=170679 RepID=UPI003BB4A29C
MQKFQISYPIEGKKKFNIHCQTVDDKVYFSLIELLEITSRGIKGKAATIKHLINILDDDEYLVKDNLMLVSEAGLYRIFSADNSIQGKKFMRWIMHEVLPSIREAGVYPSPIVNEGCSVFIDTDGSDISLTEFNNYLSKLDLVYRYVVVKVGCPTENITLDNEALEFALGIASQVSNSATHKELSDVSLVSLPDDQQLKLTDLRRHNPIELVFSGVSIALVVALIISGGKFELGLTKLKIELPPLGDGIEKLLRAFNSSSSDK